MTNATASGATVDVVASAEAGSSTGPGKGKDIGADEGSEAGAGEGGRAGAGVGTSVGASVRGWGDVATSDTSTSVSLFNETLLTPGAIGTSGGAASAAAAWAEGWGGVGRGVATADRGGSG